MASAIISCSSSDKEDSDDNSEESISPQGKWYDSGDNCLEVKSDGTYICDIEYSTGTWEEKDNGKYLFINYQGVESTVKVKSSKNGNYIEYNGVKYYKKQLNNTIESSDDSTISLNPFKGISFTLSGISPYCEIAINNQNCDADVQKYVEYSFDKSQYANGDVAVVTAKLNYNGRNKGCYTLT